MSCRRNERRTFPARSLAPAIALILCLVHAPSAKAEEPAPLSVWTYSFYKTVTYEAVVNAADIPLYRVMLGGTLAGAGLFTALNVTTAAAAYYVHEVAWNLFGPSMQESTSTAVNVGIEKVLLYRVVSTARNLALIYAFSGSITATLGFAVASNLLDATVYAANEYAWYTFGPPVDVGQKAASPETGPAIPIAALIPKP
ncbi:MAG: DUF2061 domain-containing protein [Proteobacteria bacterium]|nr:DUF2061 domain-containing protein [Pseudomonadota bacterium]